MSFSNEYATGAPAGDARNHLMFLLFALAILSLSGVSSAEACSSSYCTSGCERLYLSCADCSDDWTCSSYSVYDPGCCASNPAPAPAPEPAPLPVVPISNPGTAPTAPDPTPIPNAPCSNDYCVSNCERAHVSCTDCAVDYSCSLYYAYDLTCCQVTPEPTPTPAPSPTPAQYFGGGGGGFFAPAPIPAPTATPVPSPSPSPSPTPGASPSPTATPTPSGGGGGSSGGGGSIVSGGGSVSSGGSSGSGGGGGSVRSGVSSMRVRKSAEGPSASYSWDKIEAGKPTLVKVKKDEIVVYEIELSVKKKTESPFMKITALDEKPAGISSSKKVYQSIEIEHENIGDDNVGAAFIRFGVDKRWLERNDIEKSGIIMQRYEGSWKELPTRMISEDADSVFYESKTAGFSRFIIIGNAAESEAPAETPAFKQPDKEPLTGNTAAAPASDVAAAMILIIAAGGAVAFAYRKNFFRNRQELPNTEHKDGM